MAVKKDIEAAKTCIVAVPQRKRTFHFDRDFSLPRTSSSIPPHPQSLKTYSANVTQSNPSLKIEIDFPAEQCKNVSEKKKKLPRHKVVLAGLAQKSELPTTISTLIAESAESSTSPIEEMDQLLHSLKKFSNEGAEPLSPGSSNEILSVENFESALVTPSTNNSFLDMIDSGVFSSEMNQEVRSIDS
ncbi:MAG: hypothetical protein SGCHY_002653 [Lobulomycetales sp.]